MKPADLNFVKRLAAARGVTLADAGVRQGQTLGYAIDSVLAAAERFGGEESGVAAPSTSAAGQDTPPAEGGD